MSCVSFFAAACAGPVAVPTAPAAVPPPSPAAAEVERVAAQRPGDVRARQLLALARLLDGRVEEAQKLWEQPPAPADEFSDFLRLWIAHASGRDPEALAELDRLREGWLRASARGGGEPSAAARRALLAQCALAGRWADAARLMPDAPAGKDEVVDLLRAYVQKGLGDPQEAAAALAETARRWDAAQPIAVRGLALCRRVDGFRLYEPFEPDYRFTPGEAALVYAEVEPVTQEVKGFAKRRIQLEYKLWLVDEQGRTVPTPEWAGYNPRLDRDYRGPVRDLAVPLHIELPRTLRPGRYALHVRFEDKLAKDRAGEATAGFEVGTK